MTVSQQDGSVPLVPLTQLLVGLETGARPRGGVRNITSGVPSIGGEHLNNQGSFRLDRVRYVPDDFADTQTKGWIRLGDVLVVKDGATTGKTALVRDGFPYERALANEHVFVCRPNDLLDPAFLFHFLASEKGRAQILSDFRGAAQGGITRSFADKVRVPLPPLPLQRSLVAQVDQQLSRLDAAVASLRVAADKADLVVRSELARLWKAAGQWQWLTLGELSNASDYGTSQKALADGQGPPVLRIPNVVGGELDLRELKFATDPNQLGDELRPGDFLIIRTNGSRRLIGRGAVVVPPFANPHFHASYLIRFRLSGDDRLWRWVNYVWRTPAVRHTLEAMAATSAGQYNLNLRSLSAVALPIPPEDDLVPILDRLDRTSSLTDALRDEISASELRARTLRAAIASAAFSGLGRGTVSS